MQLSSKASSSTRTSSLAVRAGRFAPAASPHRFARIAAPLAFLLLCVSPLRAEDEDVWTIRCGAARGGDRSRIAKSYADALRKVKDLKSDKILVLDQEGETVVFYGRYVRKVVIDKNERGEANEHFRYKPDPAADLNLIRSLSQTLPDPSGGQRVDWPFALASLEAMPAREKSKVAKWELSKNKGYWTLQIAVFYNTPDMTQRRYAAEEYCRLLREEKGEEAWYDHGEVNSSVFIGSFPKAAIKADGKQNPLTGIVEVSNEITDPKLIALQKKYPHNLHNGAVFYEKLKDKHGQVTREPHASFPVKVPRDEPDPFGLKGPRRP